MRPVLIALLAVAAAVPLRALQKPAPPLFPPEDLGILEGPDRDEWQQPDRIMDVLGIADGSRVADLGAGGGWFTLRLARRVGPNGVVYAEDIQRPMIEAIQRRVEREGLANVRTILGTATDPRLPDGLQAVLVVDTFPQFGAPIEMLMRIGRALAPNGRVGIVDFKTDGGGGPGPPLADRVAPEVVLHAAAAAGLTLVSRETFLRYQYLLVFSR
jgi:ubiquinone/menaquinone biosynthesis C-methylase UbiE